MRLAALLFFLMVWAAGAAAEPVRVFAAASLKTALDMAADEWSGGTVSLSYAGSGAIARQVVAGAPADLVILANAEWMAWLEDRGALAGSPVTLATNRLVLVGAADAPPLMLTAEAIEARLGPDGRLAMGDLRGVPAGIYGAQALRALGLWDAVSPRVAQADNVRAALAFVARGEVPLGIVYASDAAVEPRVAVVADIPPASHAPILYPAALTPSAPPGASDFLAYLLGPTGQAHLRAAGFPEAAK